MPSCHDNGGDKHQSKKSKKIIVDWVALEADSEMEINGITYFVSTTRGKERAEAGLGRRRAVIQYDEGLSHSCEEVWLLNSPQRPPESSKAVWTFYPCPSQSSDAGCPASKETVFSQGISKEG